MYLFEGVLPIVFGLAKAPAHFAFQLVRHTACFSFPAQLPQPPFAGLGSQFIVP